MVPLFANKMFILKKGRLMAEGKPKELFSNTELIREVNLRSPRIAHLFEVLKKENNLPVSDDYPLTISEARKEILRLLDITKEQHKHA
jgi:cobalt/nickel transport system ATP-binding protein